MPAVTLDSNIYISTLIFGGKPLQILEMGLDGRADIAISDAILEETLGILRQKFGLEEERIRRSKAYIEAATRHVAPVETVDVVSDEPDNRVLECARASSSEFVVSGDRHLLRIGNFEGVRIVTAADFLRINF